MHLKFYYNESFFFALYFIYIDKNQKTVLKRMYVMCTLSPACTLREPLLYCVVDDSKGHNFVKGSYPEFGEMLPGGELSLQPP